MATFTRLELRNYVKDTADFSGDRNFELVNNASTTAYFNIEGVRHFVSESGDNSTGFVGHRYRDIFNTASLVSLTNCSVITGSTHASFIINRGATATFTFSPSETIPKEHVNFVASNVLVLSGSTVNGFGVNLDTDA